MKKIKIINIELKRKTNVGKSRKGFNNISTQVKLTTESFVV